MPQPNDLSRSLVALDQDSTIIAVVETSSGESVSHTDQAAAGREPRLSRGCAPLGLAARRQRRAGLSNSSTSLPARSKPG